MVDAVFPRREAADEGRVDLVPVLLNVEVVAQRGAEDLRVLALCDPLNEVSLR